MKERVSSVECRAKAVWNRAAAILASLLHKSRVLPVPAPRPSPLALATVLASLATPHSTLVALSPRSGRRHGAALLIALAFLVILSAVVLAIFTSSRGDLQNASVYASGQETLRLAETAVNIVQGQIREASTQPRVGWASQPGMIRAFNSSNEVTAYKLYSSDQMVVSNFGLPQINAETAALGSWNSGSGNRSTNAHYADLNAPAVVKRPDPADETQTIETPVFPIADPAAIGLVEGFSANASAVPGTVLTAGADRRLPMPVRWIYVLKNGELIAPTSAAGNTAVFSTTGGPTFQNPIVARIAFWTDDDTSKLNINTASDGVIWETPRATTYGEQRLAGSLPVEGEFQRLPGHPATTSLVPVLGGILPPAYANGELPHFLDAPSYNSISTTSIFASKLSQRNQTYGRAVEYFRLAPRIAGNTSDLSSQFGLRLTTKTNYHAEVSRNNLWPSSDSNTANATALVPDTDRLYATPDELIFAPNRTPSQPSLSAQELDRRQFFLTSHNRAPETNLFGLPRVSLWPVNAETSYRTVKDRLIEFCSRLGNQTYYFDRQVGSGYLAGATGADSATLDATRSRNESLLNMLRTTLSQSVPGQGSGSSFASKWGSGLGIDRVLVQAFDTVRGTNVDYVELGTGANRVIYRYGAYAGNPAKPADIDAQGERKDWSGMPRGYVNPTVLASGAKGLGRSLSFSQFAIVIMPSVIRNTYTNNVTLSNNAVWTGTETSNGINATYSPPLPSEAFFPNSGSGVRPQSQETLEARAFLVMQPYNPTPGGLMMAQGLQVEVSGNVEINGVPLGTGTTRIGAVTQERNYIVPMASMMNIQFPFITSSATINYQSDSKDNFVGKMPPPSAGFPGTPPVRGNGNAIDVYYPFVSGPIPVAGGAINFSGGTLQVTLRDFRGSSVIQRFTVNFPATVSLPAPQHMTNGNPHFAVGAVPTGPIGGNSTVDGENYGFPWDSCGAVAVKDGAYLALWKRMRLNGDGSRFKNNIIRSGDIVLGVQPDIGGSVGGDLRLIALTHEVPSSWFKPVPGYPVSGGAPSSYSGEGVATDANVAGRFNHSLRADLTASTWYAATPNSTVSTAGQGAYLGKRRNSQVEARSFRDTNAVLVKNFNNNTPDPVEHKITSLVRGVLLSNDASAVASAQMFEGALLGGSGSTLGDWGSGNSNFNDGAVQPRYEPGIIEGNIGGFYHVRGGIAYNVFAGPTFEPNRMVPSAGVLGGILTTNSSGNLQPWQTLLLNPVPAGGSAHPGFSAPRDHLFLDHFWMPVVEPYAVSEPLATAGKVNLNAQILPFTGISRTTALRGLIRPIFMSAVRDSLSNGDWKAQNYNNAIPDTIRYGIDVDKTVRNFEARWWNAGTNQPTGNFFRSGTEVTEVAMEPLGNSGSLAAWWSDKRITSDTLREQPYTALLSRVTTKSNTYTVHYRVQSLRQPPRPGRNWASWDEAQDQVTGEYRGSTTIERYLDPNTPNIPDYTTVNLSGSYDPIDKFYRWRIVSSKQFAP